MPADSQRSSKPKQQLPLAPALSACSHLQKQLRVCHRELIWQQQQRHLIPTAAIAAAAAAAAAGWACEARCLAAADHVAADASDVPPASSWGVLLGEPLMLWGRLVGGRHGGRHPVNTPAAAAEVTKVNT
jgi:hypothetical protein